MKIGVLETGAPPASLEGRFGTYGAMFRALLGPSHAYRDFDVQAGQWPDGPDDMDAFLITGSSAGVYETDPWIAQLMDFLRAARGKTRLVGVCFGHQAMAQAFGGRVIKSPRGWGIGLHTYDVRRHEPWMDDAAHISIAASHQDQVVQAPPGAAVIAASEFTPFGMLEYPGEGMASIQLHPEFAPEYAAALIETRRGSRYTDPQADAAIATLHQPNDRLAVYDALLLAAACLADCRIFYSEDLHDGLRILDRLTVRNPFRD